MQGTNRSGEGGRRACYVTPDLSYKEGENRRAKTINGTEKKRKKRKKKKEARPNTGPLYINRRKQRRATKRGFGQFHGASSYMEGLNGNLREVELGGLAAEHGRAPTAVGP